MLSEKELLNDVIAKKVFADEKLGKKYVAEIIGEVLNWDKEDVYNNIAMIHPNIGVNANIVDSEADLVYDYDSNYINIEINYCCGEYTAIKNNSYVCMLYLKDIKGSKNYKNRKGKKIIQINIDGYDYFEQDEFVYKSTMREVRYNIEEQDFIEIYHINVDKLRKESYNEITEDRLKIILFMFVCSDEKLIKTMYEGDELMGEIWKLSKELRDSFDELFYYDAKELRRKDIEAEVEKELDKVTEDVTKKVTKDVTEKTIRDTKLETAKKMLAKGIDINTIIEITDLSEEQIKNLK